MELSEINAFSAFQKETKRMFIHVITNWQRNIELICFSFQLFCILLLYVNDRLFEICVDKNRGNWKTKDIENIWWVNEKNSWRFFFWFFLPFRRVLNWLIALNVEHQGEIKVMFQVLVGNCFCHCISFVSMLDSRSRAFFFLATFEINFENS